MNDDEQIGYLLTRREALAVLSATGLTFLTGCTPGEASARSNSGSAPSACVVRPEQTEGPYFVDELIQRSDIRSDPVSGAVSAGLPLMIGFNVVEIAGTACRPLAGAVVDVWHCDAQGVYSDVQDPGFNTRGKKFLRGFQLTDARGQAQFTTIYPGWYPQRAVHIHFMVRSPQGLTSGYRFTSQVYFDDALTDKVHAQAPYSSGSKSRRRNEGDGIFREGGSQLLLALTPHNQGYRGTFDIALKTG